MTITELKNDQALKQENGFAMKEIGRLGEALEEIQNEFVQLQTKELKLRTDYKAIKAKLKMAVRELQDKKKRLALLEKMNFKQQLELDQKDGSETDRNDEDEIIDTSEHRVKELMKEK